MQSKHGVIYAIGAVGTPYVKIGRTNSSVEKRLQQLQTGQPFPLHIIASIDVEGDVAGMERHIHHFLADKRSRGEWFAIDIDALQFTSLVMQAIEYLAVHQGQEKTLPDGSPIAQQFGARVRRRRMALGFTQKTLAALVRMPQVHISRMELGHYKTMHLSRLVDLADAMHTTTDYLLCRTDDAGEVPACMQCA